MTLYPRITLVIGLDGRAELGLVPAVSETGSADDTPEAAPEILSLADAGALQRLSERIAATHGRLDLLIIDVGPRSDETGPECPLLRYSQPFHFRLLAPLMLLLPLLGRSRAGRIVALHATQADAELAACGVRHLNALVEDAGVRLDSCCLPASVTIGTETPGMVALMKRLDAGKNDALVDESFSPYRPSTFIVEGIQARSWRFDASQR